VRNIKSLFKKELSIRQLLDLDNIFFVTTLFLTPLFAIHGTKEYLSLGLTDYCVFTFVCMLGNMFSTWNASKKRERIVKQTSFIASMNLLEKVRDGKLSPAEIESELLKYNNNNK